MNIKIVKLISVALILLCALSFATYSKGWILGDEDWQYIEADGVAATDVIKSSGDDKYYIKSDGYMARDYLLENYDDDIYYFDDSGKMVKNTWVAVDPMQVENQMENPPTVYLYYFGANGKAFKAFNSIRRKTIDGKKYLFNEYGQMLSGWIDESGNRYDENDTDVDPFVGFCYYAGDETDGVLREGWSEYVEGSVEDNYYMKESLWFYFKPNDNKKMQSLQNDTIINKKINGRTYGFDSNGVMIQGWDSDMVKISTTSNYYSERKDEERGHMHKKEWVFAVPSSIQSYEDHDSETERWFYSLGGGDIVKNTLKKINSDYYVFDENGIMKKGLCIINKYTKEYVDCIDVEKTDGRDFIISRHYISMDKYNAAFEQHFDDNTQKIYYFELDEDADDFGKRKVGKLTVSFGDDDYQFESNTSGEYEGLKKKKYYQNGILLKADKAMGVGLIFLGYASESDAVAPDSKPEYYDSINAYAREDTNHKNTSDAYVKSDYIVINTLKECYDENAFPIYALIDDKGNKFTKSMSVKKDPSGYYWLIGENQCIINAFEVPIKYNKSDGVWQFKSEVTSTAGKTKTKWIDFGVFDAYGKTCYAYRTDSSLKGEGVGKEPGGYELYITDPLCVNFRFADN